MSAAARRLLAIACQGGGSHAAFGAGVLHGLLGSLPERYELMALSGTSGGAVNAALAWSGLLHPGGGPAMAQGRLRRFWEDLAAADPVDLARNLWAQVLLEQPFTWEVSPYELPNDAAATMDYLLRKHVVLEELPPEARHRWPHLLVGATDVLHGTAVAIRGDGEVHIRARKWRDKLADEMRAPFDYGDILASVAIPPLFRAVERRGTAFWDGLFSTNPPIHALTELTRPPDGARTVKPDEIWVIRINPETRMAVPHSMRDIADRRNELAGNVSLNKELDMIESVNEMIGGEERKGTRNRALASRKRITVECIEMGPEVSKGLDHTSKFTRLPWHLRELFGHGESQAARFLAGRR
jgi:NTE family protein